MPLWGSQAGGWRCAPDFLEIGLMVSVKQTLRLQVRGHLVSKASLWALGVCSAATHRRSKISDNSRPWLPQTKGKITRPGSRGARP